MAERTACFLRLNTILQYLDATPDSRCVTEGEELLFAKLLILCGVSRIENNKVTVTGLCLQTSALNSSPHEIEGHLIINNNSEVGIEHFKCTCKAGLSGTCKHVSACFFYCNRNDIHSLEKVSSTDLACYWKKSKKHVVESFGPKPVSQFMCNKKRAVMGIRTLNTEEREDCLKKLRDSQTQSILHKHFSGTCGGVEKKTATSILNQHISHNVETINNILRHAAESIPLQNLNIIIPELKPCCLKTFNFIKDVNYQAAAMVSQGSKEWDTLRQLRITGSSCYSVYTFSKKDWNIKNKNFFNPKKIKTAATEHGLKYEKEALTLYEQSCPYQVINNVGIFICEKFPWFGYSPDAIVIDKEDVLKLVEVKCPLIGQEDALSTAKKCKYIIEDDGYFELKKNHMYYGQVQFGMALLNVSICDFIIYSPKSQTFVKIEVTFDLQFCKNLLETVSYKYFEHMIHFNCNKS